MKFRAHVLFCLAGLLTAVPAAQAHFFSGFFSWFYKKPVASIAAPEQNNNIAELRRELDAARRNQEEILRQAREAVKFLAVQRSKEKKTADRRLDALNMQWRDAQIEIAELKASIQENLTKREVPGKVTQSSSSSKVRLGWWELPEETEIDLQKKGHMPKPKKGCWWA